MHAIVSKIPMIKNVIVFLFILVIVPSVYSQFDAQISQYMLHQSAFNPAAVGQSKMIDVIGQHRLQWIGMPGAGSTTNFSINTPIKIKKQLHGVGLRFLDDRFGGFRNQALNLQYAYKKLLRFGDLSFGADVGFVSVGFAGDSVAQHKITLGEYHNQMTTDPDIPQVAVQGMAMDLNVGIMYSSRTWYAGASVKHINNPLINWDTNEFTVPSTVYLTGGFNYYLPNPAYIMRPSALIKTDFKNSQIDLSALIEYNNEIWGGMSYRLNNSVVLMAGMNITGGLSLSYSFDISNNKLITSNYGSHEVLLIYSFEYVFSRKKTKCKCIRHL